MFRFLKQQLRGGVQKVSEDRELGFLYSQNILRFLNY